MNDFAPILSSKLPGGMSPSGKSFAEALLAVRKEVYEKYEEYKLLEKMYHVSTTS